MPRFTIVANARVVFHHDVGVENMCANQGKAVFGEAIALPEEADRCAPDATA